MPIYIYTSSLCSQSHQLMTNTDSSNKIFIIKHNQKISYY